MRDDQTSRQRMIEEAAPEPKGLDRRTLFVAASALVGTGVTSRVVLADAPSEPLELPCTVMARISEQEIEVTTLGGDDRIPVRATPDPKIVRDGREGGRLDDLAIGETITVQSRSRNHQIDRPAEQGARGATIVADRIIPCVLGTA